MDGKVTRDSRVKLRAANFADVNDIANLHAKSWQENYSAVLSADYLKQQVLADRISLWTKRLKAPSAEQCVLVLENSTGIIGFICLFGDKDETYGTLIDNLHVQACHQGCGFGALLLNNAANWAHKYFPESALYLEVLAVNTHAIGFYSALDAKKSAQGYWHTPCGNQSPEYVYCWPSATALMLASAAKC